MPFNNSQVAIEHGQTLPAFPDPESARRVLFEYRDRYLSLLSEASQTSELFDADYTPASLKTLESWYFEVWDSQSFCSAGMGRREFEIAIAMYFGEVFVRNGDGFEWTVREYAFNEGKYELGVRKGSLNIMLSRFTDLFARPKNKKRQSIWREYRKYTAAQPTGAESSDLAPSA